MNAQVISSMQILEIDDMSKLPLMKTVRKQFLKLAKAKHPDGGVGSEEDFVELLEAKEYLMNHIKHNKQDENDDEEESLCRKEFDDANITTINEDSVTVKIPNDHVSSWRKVLNDKFGTPRLLIVKHGVSPHQYKTETGVAITSWLKEKSKDKKSTILVQGRTAYIKFAQVTLPNLEA